MKKHTPEFITDSPYDIMAKEFVHECCNGERRIFWINDALEYAMLKVAPHCPSCGKSLLG